MNTEEFVHVKILPWVGDNYQNGGEVFRQRTLVLGGSHYSPDHDTFHTEEGQAEWQGFTQEVVDYYFSDKIQGRWKGTYSSFINSVFGGQTDNEQRSRFFDSVIFYNYLQEIAGEQASDAGKYNYAAPQHFEAFYEILMKFKPEVVIAWGAKVWEALPNDWRHGAAVIGEPLIINDQRAKSVYTYPFNEMEIRLVGIHHPSIGYETSFHHELFTKLNILA